MQDNRAQQSSVFCLSRKIEMSEHSAKTVGSLGPEVCGLEWQYPAQHPNTPQPDGQEGGIAVMRSGQIFGVKASRYRLPELKLVSGVHQNDIFPLQGVTSEGEIMDGQVGIEMELLSVDSSGQPATLRNNGGAVLNRELEPIIGEHPELYQYTAEIDDGPHLTTDTVPGGIVKKLRALQAAMPVGMSIDPASAWMDRVPTHEDVTDNPYVRVMVDLLGDHILNFVGHGIHEHYDVDPDYIHIAGRYMQILAPLLNAGLQAAPYMHGQLQPRLSEIFAGHKDLEPLLEVERASNQAGWYSVRYPTRSLASPSGGVSTMTHETKEEVLRYADQRLRDGVVNNVSRAYGQHGDVRLRYDLPPGRVELCVKDDPLARVETITAYMDMAWAVVGSIETYARAGQLEQLHTAFRGLFGSEVDPAEMTPLFERTHRNSLRLAKDGPQAQIEDGHGCFVPTPHLVEQLFDFCDAAAHPISHTSRMIVRGSLQSDQVRTSSTINDYYRTGTGTPADYHKVRASDLRASGMSERAILQQLTKERVQAFSGYLTLHTA